ncbi:MAG: bifunctional heptose 7-phosphate kinase/heptose 1-phosphate adenyltransferase [Vicinamibacterales bacterium]
MSQTPLARDVARRLLDVLNGARGRRVVVLGDLIADEFVSGRIARVSREAPVLILEYDRTTIVPGGAGNAASNVAALGGTAALVALAGRDEPGRRVLAAFPSRVDRRAVLRPAGYHTPVKTRILAGGVHSAKQQVVRIDRATREPVADAWRAAWLRAASRALRHADAVLVSDYGSGLITPPVVAAQAAPLRRGRRRVPVLVDSRYDLLRYRGLTACTPNESEVEHALGLTIGDSGPALERAGRAILRRTRMDAVLVTRGSRGMALFEAGVPTTHIPIFGSDEIADVTGAGDTVMAALTLALAAGASMADAARLANYAGGLVVMKRGTATVSARELARAVAADRGGR